MLKSYSEDYENNIACVKTRSHSGWLSSSPISYFFVLCTSSVEQIPNNHSLEFHRPRLADMGGMSYVGLASRPI
jgi:hypothetical protein